MTRDQKNELAYLVRNRVADIVEFWGEMTEGTDLESVDPEEAREVIAGWMRRLPGNIWDTRLD